MLVLGLSEQDSVVVGEDILISVLGVRRSTVRFALQGQISFLRGELLENSGPIIGDSGKAGCLVLSRRAQETISIGELGLLKVTRISGSRVSLGFDIDRSVRILRLGVYEQEHGSFTHHEQPWKKAA